ncbi:MAG: hypothetical protein ACOZF0_03955 [Thermodesulfobacteriota bacterium]
MRHNYLILNGENENELRIKESAELDKGMMTLVFEEVFDRSKIEAAQNDDIALLAAIRTPSFYPARNCAVRLAEAVRTFLQSGGKEPVEMSFDDSEFLSKIRIEREPLLDELDTSVEIDDLLEDEIEDENFLEESDIKSIASPPSALRVADDDDALLAEDEEK